MLRTILGIAVAGFIAAMVPGLAQAAPAAPLRRCRWEWSPTLASCRTLPGVAAGVTAGDACTTVAAGVTAGAASAAGNSS